MPTVLAGIDEAGYGPMLGPLCVGLSVLRVPGGDGPPPDLWDLLGSGVAREPGRGGATDKQGRVAIADSKRLKLSNAVTTTHPLVHLERGVLAFLRAAGVGVPATDGALFDTLGVQDDAPACYRTDEATLPVALTPGEIDLAAGAVERACARAGVQVLRLRADVTWEPRFNEVVRTAGNKGEATAGALGRLFREVWESWSRRPDGATTGSGGDAEPWRLGVVCDRLGGRTSYAALLEGVLPGAKVTVIEESDVRSRYVVEREGVDGVGRAAVTFLTEGERSHLPVALASMIAKYTRELAMARFNAYWSVRVRDDRAVELRPTAGYAQDARRWLHDVGGTMTPAERATLVRIA
jgi:hypothetical protein